MRDLTQEGRRELIQEMRFIVDKVRDDVLAIAPGEGNPLLIDSIFRGVHTVKGCCGVFRLEELGEFSERLELLLGWLRNGECRVDRETLDLLIEGTDAMADMIEAIDRLEPVARDLLLERRIRALFVVPSAAPVSSRSFSVAEKARHELSCQGTAGA